MSLQVYTDGSCKPNPGAGGWAWIHYFESDGNIVVFSDSGGSSSKTTQNRMELQAVIEFLRSFKKKKFPCEEIHIYSDSTYVVKTIGSGEIKFRASGQVIYSGYANSWKIDSYKIYKKGKIIKNYDLWLDLDNALHSFFTLPKIYFYWVKGHSGNYGNDLADKLAGEAVLKNVKKRT